MTHERSGRDSGLPIATSVAGIRLIAALIVALTVSFSVAISIAVAAERMEQRRSVEALIADSLRADHHRSGPSDDQYHSNGRWFSGDDSYWPTTIGPATAAAVLYRQTRAPWLAEVSKATINRAIATYRQADGSFGETSKGNDIETMTFASELGRSYLALGEALKPAKRAEWRDALRGAADFLIANGNLAWYTNGNIVLGNAEIMALAYRVTGQARYRSAYLRAFEFAIAPPQDRWPGYGLHLTKAPTRADGADGAGYLAEASSPGAEPGFDPEYTQLQLDIASRIHLLMRDERSLRLTNELTNALLPRSIVAPGCWTRVVALVIRSGTQGAVHDAGAERACLARSSARDSTVSRPRSSSSSTAIPGRPDVQPQELLSRLGDQVAPILEAVSDRRGGASRSAG